MKKVLMILLSAMLVLSMVGFVSADTATSKEPITHDFLNDQTTGSTTSDTKVTLALSQSFEVELPADFALTAAAPGDPYTGLAHVKATVYLLNVGNQLTVSVSSTNVVDDSHVIGGTDNYWVLKNGNEELKYVIKDASNDGDHVNLAAPTEWLAEGENFIMLTGQGVQEKYLHFRVSDAITNVGTFTDTLTFTISVSDTTTNA